MSEDNLDNFLLQNSEDNSSQNTVSNVPQFSQNNTLPNRPKLKKIKRPKIRPAVDIPQAPEKVMPSFQATSVEKQNILEGENKVHFDRAPSQKQEEDILYNNLSAPQDSSFQVSSSSSLEQTDEDSSAYNEDSNALVRVRDTQNMTPNTNNSNLSFSLDDLDADLADEFVYDEDDGGEIFQNDSAFVKKNIAYIVAGICLFVGLFIGKTLFSSQTIENHGLEGVVVNSDVPAGRPRCGLTDKSQACVFYLMNWERQELNGRDFYKLAAYFTGREEYMIETENLRYATVKIKPGAFAQLNIPALK